MIISFDPTTDRITQPQADALVSLIATLVVGVEPSTSEPPPEPPPEPAPKPSPDLTPEPAPKPTPKPAPKKRTRRTKDQIAADKRQAESDKALLEAAKQGSVAAPQVSTSEVAPAVESETATADEPEESAPAPPTGALSTGDMRAVVSGALERLTEGGDPNPTKTVVGLLVKMTGKNRISEIDTGLYPDIAAHLETLEYAAPADDPLS